MVFYLCSVCWKAQKVASGRNTRWRQRKLTPRLHFRHQVWEYTSQCLKHRASTLTKEALNILSLFFFFFVANPLQFFCVHCMHVVFDMSQVVQKLASLGQKFGKLNEFYLLCVLCFSSSQDKSNNILFPDKMCFAQSSANILQILVTCVYSSIL